MGVGGLGAAGAIAVIISDKAATAAVCIGASATNTGLNKIKIVSLASSASLRSLKCWGLKSAMRGQVRHFNDPDVGRDRAALAAPFVGVKSAASAARSFLGGGLGPSIPTHGPTPATTDLGIAGLVHVAGAFGRTGLARQERMAARDTGDFIHLPVHPDELAIVDLVGDLIAPQILQHLFALPVPLLLAIAAWGRVALAACGPSTLVLRVVLALLCVCLACHPETEKACAGSGCDQ
jgi:hypothetical protein